MREVAADAISQARVALDARADDEPLGTIDAYLHAEPEYQRQRRIHAEHGMRGLLTDLVSRTLGNTRTPLADRRELV